MLWQKEPIFCLEISPVTRHGQHIPAEDPWAGAVTAAQRHLLLPLLSPLPSTQPCRPICPRCLIVFPSDLLLLQSACPARISCEVLSLRSEGGRRVEGKLLLLLSQCEICCIPRKSSGTWLSPTALATVRI